MNWFVPPPIFLVSSLLLCLSFLLLENEYVQYIHFLYRQAQMAYQNILCPSRYSLGFSASFRIWFVLQVISANKVNRVYSLLLRVSIEGFHSRRRERVFWFIFFPRSVGLLPTASSLARGAFTEEESALCHSHEIPSIQSSSAIQLFQSFAKNQASFHSLKCLCTELGLPN